MPSPIQQERGSSPSRCRRTRRSYHPSSSRAEIATRRRARQSHGYSGHVRPTRAERTISRISQHRTFALSVAMCGQRLPGRKHLEVFFGVLPTVAASHETSHGLARVDPDGLSRAGQNSWTDQDKRALGSTCRTPWRRLLILRCWVRAPDGPPIFPGQGMFLSAKSSCIYDELAASHENLTDWVLWRSGGGRVLRITARRCCGSWVNECSMVAPTKFDNGVMHGKAPAILPVVSNQQSCPAQDDGLDGLDRLRARTDASTSTSARRSDVKVEFEASRLTGLS